MRIDELERTIGEHTVQAARERVQAQHFCKEYADKASTYYDAAYQRELMVIKMLKEAEAHYLRIQATRRLDRDGLLKRPRPVFDELVVLTSSSVSRPAITLHVLIHQR